jgi:hypothetical protein
VPATNNERRCGQWPGAAIKYLLQTTSGAAGNDPRTTAKYLRGDAGIGLGTTVKYLRLYSEYFSNYPWLFRTRMPVLRRQDLLWQTTFILGEKAGIWKQARKLVIMSEPKSTGSSPACL